MTDIVITIAAKVAEYLVAPIGRQLRYLFCYRSYTDDLNNKVQELGRVRDDLQRTVQRTVGDESKRAGYALRPIVHEWLNRVDGITKDAEELMKDENKSCFNGWCPNLKSRYLLSRKADKKAQVIVQIQKEGNFPHGVSDRVPLRNLTFKNYEPFGSRALILDDIMGALGDDKIKMIGVWGMGGVGKTTLVKQVAEQAKQGKLFTTEVYIDVSWTRDLEKPQQGIAKIQQKIVEMLHLEFMGNEESTRAVELKLILKKEKILIILDDIWKVINLEEVGIPCKDDQTACKVVLTSREHGVLSKHMGTHKDVHVNHLCEEEAWKLFKKTAGDVVEEHELRPIATEVVKKCEGLPVAIVTIATALRGETVAIWRNALQELTMSAATSIEGVTENVYSCLELSYNHLKSVEAKSLFLLCGSLGDGDISLDDLLKYGIGLDLFNNIDSLEKARDRVVALVEILKTSSLLLEVDVGHYRGVPSLSFVEEGSNGFARMHDVVRDVAKAIALKDPHQFVVIEALGLQGWQQMVLKLENRTRISLNCRDIHELPERLVCRKLEFFLLNGNDNFLKIPDTFFEDMGEVRVLSLFSIDLGQMPSSLHLLPNLRILCIHRCRTAADLTILGELKNLQILSLVLGNILELPEKMKQLTDLRMLSLRCCQILDPRNVISSLSRLEYLCMRNSFDSWESGGVDGGRRNACLYELKHLSCLRALELVIPSSCLLPKDVCFEKLTRYNIIAGCEWDLCFDSTKNNDSTKASRRLLLREVKGRHLLKCSELLKTVEVLELIRLVDIKHFVYELDCNAFPQLKYLFISKSDAMQYIINTLDMEWVRRPHLSAFPLLEELELRYLNQLEAVCHGPIPMGCFANLRVLIIEWCLRLKYILWLPTTQARESVLVFPQLGSLKLEHLPNLINFYSTGTSGSQEACSSFFNQVALPRLESLHLNSMDDVRTIWDKQYLIGSSSQLENSYLEGLKNLLTDVLEGLQSLQIENCHSLKEIFKVGEINSAEIDGIEDPPLKEMCLHGQNVKSMRKKDPQGYLAFQNLNSLRLDNCNSLKYVFPASIVKGLEQLKNLEIRDCGVEEIVSNENGVEAVPMFLFPRLITLTLYGLSELKRFSQEKYTLTCSLLKKLDIQICYKVEVLFQEKSLEGELDKQPLFVVEKNTFPNLEELRVGSEGLVEIWRGQYSRDSFGKLRFLMIENCNDISVAIPCSKLPVLQNLEQLEVCNCISVEEVIQGEELVGETIPRLTKINLISLPMLMDLSSLQPILQNLHSLRVSWCENLRNLVSPSMVERLVNLKELCKLSCSSVKEIVRDDGSEATDDVSFTKLEKLQLFNLVKLESFSSASNSFKFPSLEEVEITELASLTHLYKIIPGQNLQKLRILKISGCENLEFLLTLSMVKTLEELTVSDCDKVKVIVESERGEATDNETVDTKLQKLKLQNLPNLKSFCSARYCFIFRSLTCMEIKECPQLEFFCVGDSFTPSLEFVRMNQSVQYLKSGLNTIIQNEFREMHSKEEVPDEEMLRMGILWTKTPRKTILEEEVDP